MKLYDDRRPGGVDGFVLRTHSPNMQAGFAEAERVGEILPRAYRIQKLTMMRNVKAGDSRRGGNRVSVTIVIGYRGAGPLRTRAEMEERLDLQP